ncbi:HIT family protein, partial [Streptomyces sp. SID337]|nr:HIT family protein [Streptomyces sp. SID337]
SVFHLHVHVVPRYTGDRMPRLWPEPAPTDADRLDDSVRRLRAALDAPRDPSLQHE